MTTDPAPDDGAPAPLFREDEIDLSDLRWEDGLVLAVFWVLAVVVFLQFFTRYVLNNSFGWTEEIARYLLIGLTFVGACMAVRKQSHIAVEFLYRWATRPLRRTAQTLIDLIALVFYAAMAWYSAGIAMRTSQTMVSISLPKSIIYWTVAACFVAMTLYAIRVALVHWRTGTSPLIDPDLHAQHVMD
jgi:TRAP-type C4-dicarboxylate transport system permease small subunit